LDGFHPPSDGYRHGGSLIANAVRSKIYPGAD
jgi:hypothetical protein